MVRRVLERTGTECAPAIETARGWFRLRSPREVELEPQSAETSEQCI